MTRRWWGLVVAGLALLAMPASALGAEPEIGPFVDAASAITDQCDEYEPDHWLCSAQNDARYVSTSVTAFETSFQVQSGRNRFDAAAPVPAEPDLLAHWSDLVTLALGDDPVAQDWLLEMNAGPQAFGELVRGAWTLTWQSQMLELSEPPVANIGLDLFYFPTASPGTPPPSFAAPSGSVAPDAEPTDGPSATPEPRTAEAPVPAAPPSGPGATRFADSIPAVGEISTDPIVLVQSALLAVLLVFLMPFPAQLFNSTLETHEDEVRGWLRLDRLGAVAGGTIGAFWSSWPGVIVFTLLAALLFGFLDPGFGLDLGSVATFFGMLAGIVLVTAVFGLPAIWAHRRIGDAPAIKVVPISLVIGVACVVLSRLTDFQPGYLYGLLVGLVFARELSEADEGRATALGAVLMLVVSFASWLALGLLPDGDGFGLVVSRTSLAALMVAGLEGVVFGLLPMRFLPGEPLYAWNRVVWGALLGLGAFAFFHVLINPASGYLSDTSRTPLLTVVALLIGFSVVSVAFWAWFRFRREPPAEEALG